MVLPSQSSDEFLVTGFSSLASAMLPTSAAVVPLQITRQVGAREFQMQHTPLPRNSGGRRGVQRAAASARDRLDRQRTRLPEPELSSGRWPPRRAFPRDATGQYAERTTVGAAIIEMHPHGQHPLQNGNGRCTWTTPSLSDQAVKPATHRHRGLRWSNPGARPPSNWQRAFYQKGFRGRRNSGIRGPLRPLAGLTASGLPYEPPVALPADSGGLLGNSSPEARHGVQRTRPHGVVEDREAVAFQLERKRPQTAVCTRSRPCPHCSGRSLGPSPGRCLKNVCDRAGVAGGPAKAETVLT